MSTDSILLAKIAALQKNFSSLRWGQGDRILGSQLEHLIDQYFRLEADLKEKLPELYSDLPNISSPEPSGKNTKGINIFDFSDVVPIIQNINYILEVRANHRIGEKKIEKETKRTIFISHGRSDKWYKVQAFLEKDLGLQTLELAQEANLGRTILQKLNEESRKCRIAVIVMTGDNKFNDETRARENVLHEIGYFQGKYGLQNIILLHEEDVNIPSNIHGLVYIPFPKETVEATFGALQRELKVLIAE